jgi:hypothetical protein
MIQRQTRFVENDHCGKHVIVAFVGDISCMNCEKGGYAGVR